MPGLLSIPTCNRPEALSAGLRSYLTNAREHGRRIEVFVADDSRNPAIKERNRAELTGLGREFGVPINYAGIEEKLFFLKRLLGLNPAPSEVIKFALFDSEGSGLTAYGANRNCLALHAAGRPYLSVDDDTRCAVSEFRQNKSSLEWVHPDPISESDPCEVFVGSNIDELSEAHLQPSGVDIFGAHENFLGKGVPPECKSGTPQRIRITFNGVVGDSGWPSPSMYYFLTGRSFQRFAASDAILLQNLQSRVVIRAVDGPKAGAIVNAPGMFAAFDSGLLPPFPPVGRGEDVTYWTVFQKSDPTAAMCYVPEILQHVPAPRPNQAGSQPPVGSFDFFMLQVAAIRAFAPTQGAFPLEQGLASLGGYLQTLGSRGDSDFAASIAELARREAKATLDFIERQSGACPPQTPYCRDHLRKMAHTASAWMTSGGTLVHVGRSNAPAAERGMAGRLLRRFGQLLCHWPAISQSVAALASQGVRLGIRLS